MIPRSLLLLCLVAAVIHAADDNVVSVPKDLMRFILGCQRLDPSRSAAVPVYSVDIDEKGGTTSQKFGLLKMDELGHALRQTVDNEAVVGEIMAQVQDAVTASASSLKGRRDCNVENKISIAIPPQEMDQFNDKMQQVEQQNNYLLLEQINNLFTYKLHQQSDSTEKLLKRKLKQIDDKLNIILQVLGKEMALDDNDDASTEAPPVDTDESPESAAVEKPGCNCRNNTKSHSDSSGEADAETEPDSEPEPTTPKAEPEPEPEPQPSSEKGSAEVLEPTPEPATTTTAPSASEPGSQEAEPEREPETEQQTTTTPQPTTRPTPRPLPAIMTTLRAFPIDDSGSDEDSGEDNSSASSSSEPPVGFERVAQKPVGIYNSMGLLRPTLHRERIRLSHPVR